MSYVIQMPSRRALAALGALLLAAAPAAVAGAQGSVPGAAAKRAAENAVAATNAHTEAMTSPTAGAQAPTTAKPQAKAQAPRTQSPAPTRATVAVKPAASNAQPQAKQQLPATTKPAAGKAAVAAATGGAKPAGPTTAPASAAAPAYAARSKPGTPDQGTATVSVTEREPEGQLTFQRETFEYGSRGRRDPFVSLIKSGEIRPLFADLKLVTVLYDPTGRNSVAIMHDVSTKDQYRVKVGQTLGRMRVSQIQPKQVVFAIEEFGYGRQAVLALNDSTRARKQ
jgi:hypothetical protein